MTDAGKEQYGTAATINPKRVALAPKMTENYEVTMIWHATDAGAVLAELETDFQQGLSTGDISRRLEEYGANELPTAPRDSWLKRFFLQFHNVLIYILLAAAVGTALLQEWIDTGVILGVVLINALIGVVQEGKAEKALESIRAMLSPKAMVRRDGHRETINAGDLVPGDIVMIKAGDRVPADLRLIEVQSLRVDEALLTGESVPVEKSAESVEEIAELGDRFCLAYSGTLATYGRASGVVVATGAATEIGKVSGMLSRVQSVTTPLLRQMAQFGRWLSAGIVVVAGATFAFGYWIRGFDAVEMFMAAVSLAVAAIPEGLPAIMTITLAIGVQRMARRNAIIRRLPAVETLGSVTVICSDKTGTLTKNEMTVQNVVMAETTYRVGGAGYEPVGDFIAQNQVITPDESHSPLVEVLRASILCNESAVHQTNGSWNLEGEPTEGSLMVLAMKGGLDRQEIRAAFPRLDSIPFDSAHKFMATLHRDGTRTFIVMKGAPEAVLKACDMQRTRAGDEPLDLPRWENLMLQTAREGQRLLAIATKSCDGSKRGISAEDLHSGLTLLGVAGIIDPPRDEAIAAVETCRRAGIRVKMITGDHAVTARSIGEALGIGNGADVITGQELQKIDDDHLPECAASVDVFARATPEHKLRLVTALQASGHVVAMTGDGVNDAPALKRADVGIAMGRKGTEAAKEAASMVLADDNFASIAHAVEEGRTVYDNLKKAILFILPTNGGQGLTIVAAVILGLSLPLLPVQVLWVNMVTAVTLALALAFEPPEPGLMTRPPREARTPLLTPLLVWRVAFVSVLLVAGTFGHYLLSKYDPGTSEEFARTVAINTLVVGQVFYLFNSRYILAPSWNIEGITGSRPVLLAVAILLVLQAVFTYSPPLQSLFHTVPIGPSEWLRITFFGLVLFFAVEIEKAVLRRMSLQSKF
jgi:magnesium-transporting ATPase (P-type)